MHDDRRSFLELRGGLEPSQHRDYKSRPLPNCAIGAYGCARWIRTTSLTYEDSELPLLHLRDIRSPG